MKTVISKDGTQIAYDQTGTGQPLILVGGAFSYRLFPGFITLRDALSPHFSVINYDRRGRGNSGDTQPYAVEREIEDLAALIEAVGGSALVWGMSSGAVLALRAAASGLNISKLAVYEPPFMVEASDPIPPADFKPRMAELVAKDKRGEAIKYFMNKGMGVPGIFLLLMRVMPGVWPRLKAVAHTLPYDIAIMGDTTSGKPLSAQEWAAVGVPTQVMAGGKSAKTLRNSAQALTNILPNAQYHVLEGQSHNVSFKALAVPLIDYLQA